MPSLPRLLIATGLLAIAVSHSAVAQRLPKGEYHTNRDRNYDIQHYRADLEFDLTRRAIHGTARIELTPLQTLSTIVLDAIQLQIESVTLNDEDSLKFSTDGQRLTISLPEPKHPGDSITLQVIYAATPRAGMAFGIDPNQPDKQFVTTYGEGGIHANWLPIYNDVNDKFTSEMRITVPLPYTVVSNGVLLKTVDEPGDRRTFHWKQERPHSNYLIALYVGDFERGELKPAFGTIPLAYWVPRGRLAEGAWTFRNTTRMVEFYSRRFDYTYPWVKYDQIAVPDYPVGAMEHTGVTGHNASVLRTKSNSPDDFSVPSFDEYHTDWTAEATISHELAHHWFGDNLTCRNLSHLWLNESFASYLMMLWSEELHGQDQLLFDVELARRHYLRFVDDTHMIRPLEYHFFDTANDIYNEETTYLKGGAVLHMLRSVLGDDAFFGALGDYLDKHEFGNVESHDLKVAIEESTGRNLDRFFSDWITGGGHPRFEITARYLEDLKMVDLNVQQVQAIVEGQGLFRLPVTVTISTPDKTWDELIWVESESDSYLIPSPAEPLMVSFDGRGSLVAEIEFEKSIGELTYQSRNDAVVGRMRALGQLVQRFPSRSETIESLRHTITADDVFWGLRAEAARLLDQVRTDGAIELMLTALASPDFRVRKAAVLAIPGLGIPNAGEILLRTIQDDSNLVVSATAIVALARTEPTTSSAIFSEQLKRESWYDQIRIAVQVALEELARPDTLELIRPYVEPRYSQDLRQAALTAWAAVAPTDPALHAKLLKFSEHSPYKLQIFALEELGKHYVTDAVPGLERWIKRDVDSNITKAAQTALDEIHRVHGVSD